MPNTMGYLAAAPPVRPLPALDRAAATADNGNVIYSESFGPVSRRKCTTILASAIAAAFLPKPHARSQTQEPVSKRRIPIRGTYSSPNPFWQKGATLGDYGIKAVFVHGGSINEALYERATKEGAEVYAEFATLNGKGYVEQNPEAWPINEKGERAPAATWFLGACPTEPGFREYRRKQLEDLLGRFPLAGVWMDYFHWHAQFEEPEPTLPETCFCNNCLARFEKESGIRLPSGELPQRAAWILKNEDRRWRDWRVSVLVGWAQDFRRIVKSKRPSAKLGVYHCPWTDDEFGGARRRVLGLDFDRLAPEIDVFSPMVYHGRMGRNPEWVREYVEWLSAKLLQTTEIWPIVQAHNDPGVISAAEFEQVMRGGVSGRATGIQMFTVRSVAEDPAKLQTLQELYREWGG